MCGEKVWCCPTTTISSPRYMEKARCASRPPRPPAKQNVIDGLSMTPAESPAADG